jgi:hypothetical protein
MSQVLTNLWSNAHEAIEERRRVRWGTIWLRRPKMSILTLEGVVEGGWVRLVNSAALPENSKVYVVVPDASLVPATQTLPADEKPDRPERMRRAENQYRLARQYPGEYVVLVGEHTIHHSQDRQEAIAAFRHAALDFPPHRPVFIRPGGRPRKPPVVRGRALALRTGDLYSKV